MSLNYADPCVAQAGARDPFRRVCRRELFPGQGAQIWRHHQQFHSTYSRRSLTSVYPGRICACSLYQCFYRHFFQPATMASPSLFRSSTRPDLYVCARCAFRASSNPQKTAMRWIGIKYLTKVADAEMTWQQKAWEIKDGKKKSMLSILEERGLVHQITGYASPFYAT